jgi:hypothetical protein
VYSVIVSQHGSISMRFLFLIALLVATSSAFAQGLDKEGAIDTIVGSDVTTGEEAANKDEGRIIKAIENSSAAAAAVRRKFSLDKVEIVYIPDVDDAETSLEAKLEQYKPQVNELRESIQGSAMFYHAIDSRSIMLTDVIAVEFDDANGVTIFVSGEKPVDQ